jgi:hypothetical protein
VRPGEYSFSDKTYDRLLTKLSEKKFAGLTPGLAADILKFYATMPSPDSHGAGLALDSLKAYVAAQSSQSP